MATQKSKKGGIVKFSGSQLDLDKARNTRNAIRAIDHPLRKDILIFLDKHKGKVPVTEIYLALHIDQSVASQMLGILKKAELVNYERKGKEIIYSVNHTTVKNLNQRVA